jgi:glycine betaine/proline transport system permease protein
MSDSLESLIDGILWLLQTPHPLVIVALFVALTWASATQLERSALGSRLGFLFIMNQGYWKDHRKPDADPGVLRGLHGIGVPIGIAAAHRPKLYRPCSRCLT